VKEPPSRCACLVPPRPAGASALLAQAAARKTVFVVDDEDEICDTLRDIFEDEGYAVATARDGAEALALLQNTPTKPCIVILDLLMPVMDGNALYDAMRSDPVLADVAVVISTSDPSRAPHGLPVIRKPIKLDDLLGVVRRCC
jgi:CheY-like chemotaxis protein